MNGRGQDSDPESSASDSVLSTNKIKDKEKGKRDRKKERGGEILCITREQYTTALKAKYALMPPKFYD